MQPFSERMGITSDDQLLQVDEISDSLRNRLWNVVYSVLFCEVLQLGRGGTYLFSTLRVPGTIKFFRALWNDFFHLPIDDIPALNTKYDSVFTKIKYHIQQDDWFEVYDLVEFMLKQCEPRWKNQVAGLFNRELESEKAGYRFVGVQLTPITDKIEIQAIEQAVSAPFESAGVHLQAAIEFFSDRENPDYRNSIKEAISAVEASCKFIVKKDSASLGDCLRVLKTTHPMHGAFEQALHKLYGYTSDEGGIRHSLTDDSLIVTGDDAKFMLVLCSSFVNYLTSLAASGGLGFENR